IAETNPLIVRLLKRTHENQIQRKLKIFAKRGKLCILRFTSAEVVTIKRPILATVRDNEKDERINRFVLKNI
ncbi:hypothetical protein HHI36_021863, partial [Cryptolaemus montrouzieri]